MSSTLAAARRAAEFFERFGPADLAALDAVYREDATFKDPFNEVRGLAAIRQVYRHMFDTLDDPRFDVWNCTAGEGDAWLAWRFTFGAPGARLRTVRGVSHLVFDDSQRIVAHRDYWDPVEELYLDVPVLGWLHRAIRRRLAAPGIPGNWSG
jgi:steroid Delta-isomerase